MVQDALPNVDYQPRVNTNRVWLCDGRADDEQNKNILGSVQ